MHNCSLQNTTKAVLINKQTLTKMIPMVSGVLCGMDLGGINQVLVHLLHFSRGAEEEPGRRSLGSCCSSPKLQQCIPCLTKIAKCYPAFCSAFFGDSQRALQSLARLDRHTELASVSCISASCGDNLCEGITVTATPSTAPFKKHLPLGALLCFPTQTTPHCQPRAAPIMAPQTLG